MSYLLNPFLENSFFSRDWIVFKWEKADTGSVCVVSIFIIELFY